MNWHLDRESVRSRRPAWGLAIALAAGLAGCDGGRSPASETFYPVKGKVLLPDGKPLAGVGVHFQGPYSAIADTQGDGTFTVKAGDREGLPQGEYQVRLEGGGSKSSRGKATLPFPSRYMDEDASGLTARVTPSGPNDFEFKLTRGDAGGASARGPGGPGRVTD